MANISAAVILQGLSNLAEDRFVTTWHFSNGDAYGDHAAGVANALIAFYNTDYGGASIASRLSPWVSRALNGAEVRTYNMADLSPREPLIQPFQLNAMRVGAVTQCPEEVAVCLTLEAAPPVTRSRRGRVYVGPWTSDAVGAASVSTPTRVGGQIITTLKGAATALQAAGLGWSVYSRKNGTFAPIVGGYVDNAFDVQRRRGPDPTSRTVWP